MRNSLPPHRTLSRLFRFPSSRVPVGLLAASFLITGRAVATDYTFISSTAANWTTNGTWQTSGGATTGFPSSNADNVVGNSAIGILQVDTNETINNFTISTVASASIWNIDAPANRSLTIGGTLTMNGAGSATFRNGSSPLALTAANVQVNSGQLAFGNNTTQLGNLIVSGSIKVNSGAVLTMNVNQSTLNLGGLVVDGTAGLLNSNSTVTRTIGVTALAGGGVVGVNIGGTGASVLTLALTSSSSGTFSGVLQNGGNGTLSFTKAGLGAQTLSGNSTYTGATTVQAGTLLVSGGLSSSSAATVAGGATLGVGNAAGAVSFKTLAVASMTVGSVGLESTIALNLGSSANDAVASIGALALTNSQKLNLVLTDTTLVGMTSSLSGTYTLLTWGSGGLSNLATQLDLAGSSANFDLSQFSISGNSLQFTAVPEPSIIALFGAGVGVLLMCRRFRKIQSALI